MLADVTVDSLPAPATGAPAAPVPPAAAPTGRVAAMATMAASALSSQIGAAVGVTAFPVLGPIGVVAVRQYVAAAVLLAVGRPPVRSFTRAQWWPVVLLGATFATMNVCLYLAIDRIGLGLAVTLEFLGPLSVALAAARRRQDIGWTILAAAGAIALMRPRPSTDYVGIGLALLAAACWAAYILLNRTVGRRVPGTAGAATAAMLSAIVFLPVGIVLAARHAVPAPALAAAVTAGLLASAVPYLVDLFALRRVPAAAYGMFMSVHPVFAALVGWIGLGQSLGWPDWASIAAVVAANAGSVATRARRPLLAP